MRRFTLVAPQTFLQQWEWKQHPCRHRFVAGECCIKCGKNGYELWLKLAGKK